MRRAGVGGIRTVTIGVLAGLVLTGCASKQKQLESVAKDWCMTIRASQVLPVYPLTEDLQPGDVFLVTVPIQKQVTIYKERGFLPLDLMVTRLDFKPATYQKHYQDSYWTGDFAATPHVRLVRGGRSRVRVAEAAAAAQAAADEAAKAMEAAEAAEDAADETTAQAEAKKAAAAAKSAAAQAAKAAAAAGSEKDVTAATAAVTRAAKAVSAAESAADAAAAKAAAEQAAEAADIATAAAANVAIAAAAATGEKGDSGAGSASEFDLSEDLGAPRAAFPTYSFSVEKGIGARLAIPVQGVPVAMGLMGSSSAYGSVTISDAFTYAAPTEVLIHDLKAWASQPVVRAELKELQDQNSPRPLFLRVVQRVYLTGGVVVAVTNSQSGGVAVEADLSVLGSGGETASPAGARGEGAPPPERKPVAQTETFTVAGTWKAGDTLTTTLTAQNGDMEKVESTVEDPSIEEVRKTHLTALRAEAEKDGAPLFAAITWEASSTNAITATAKEAGVPFDATPSDAAVDGTYARAITAVQAPPPRAGYAETSEALNAALAGGKKPGGSLQIIQASSRSVTMKENFDRPLVIGYIGFDFPILDEGDLGVPIATLNQLEKRGAPIATARVGDRLTPEEQSYINILNLYSKIETNSVDADAARTFVIRVADQFPDDETHAGIRAVGVMAEQQEEPLVGYVGQLRSAIDAYLEQKGELKAGRGPRTDEVLAALQAAMP